MIYVWFFMADIYLNPIMLLLGSVMPDADHRKAPMGKILPLWLFFRHRGATHRIWFLAIVAILTGLLWNWWAGLSLAIGYFSHLLLDSCTKSGLKWF